MTPNFPKPMFFAKFHPGMVVDIILGALGPILGWRVGGPGTHLGGMRWPWRPKADIMEAEGGLNGGLGAEPPGI